MTVWKLSPEDVRRLPVMFAIEVPESYVDHNGHMNVARFVDLHIRASASVLAHAGVNEYREATVHKVGFFTVEHHVRYLSEVLAGQPLTAYAMVVRRSRRSMRHVTFLINDATDRLASSCEIIVVHVDHRTRRSITIPAAVAAEFDRAIRQAADVRLAGELEHTDLGE